jgi:hypothetical protein
MCIEGIRKTIDKAHDQSGLIFMVIEQLERYFEAVVAYWPGKRLPILKT